MVGVEIGVPRLSPNPAERVESGTRFSLAHVHPSSVFRSLPSQTFTSIMPFSSTHATLRTTPHYDPFLVNPRPHIDPIPYAYDAGALPGVIDPKGYPPDVPSATVVHTHIRPSFSRNTDVEEHGIPRVHDVNAARRGVEGLEAWVTDPWSRVDGEIFADC